MNGERREDNAVGKDPAGDDALELDMLAGETGAAATGAGVGSSLFGDDDVRLPWLESDDGDDEEQGGYSAAQLLGLMIFGLLAIGLIAGGIWWGINHRKDDALVANGSVIAAPKQPYKERPKDAGGKTFAGTGDTSYAVSEGKTRPGRLGEASPVAAGATSAKPAGQAAPAESGGVGVQVAAYSNRAQAEAGWTKLSGQYEALSGLSHRVVEGSADIGTVYRLQAVAPDASAAFALCGKLKSAGLACQVKN